MIIKVHNYMRFQSANEVDTIAELAPVNFRIWHNMLMSYNIINPSGYIQQSVKNHQIPDIHNNCELYSLTKNGLRYYQQ